MFEGVTTPAPRKILIIRMGRDVRKSVGRVVTYVFFHFVLQEELTANEVILLPCSKLIVRVSYLFAVF